MDQSHTSERRSVRTLPLLLALIAATALGPFSLNLPLPSLPGLAREFGVDFAVSQLVLTLYLFALAFAQLAYGPLSDAFGRRRMMIAGILVFIAGSLLAALASSISLLIAARIVQAAGGCAGLILGRAVLRDLYGRDRAASYIGYVTMGMVVAPMVAPLLGGILEQTIGWRAGFLVAAGMGVGSLALVVAILPETAQGSGTIRQSPLRGFASLLRERAFLLYVGIVVFTSGMFFAFIGGAPYIMIELLGSTPVAYGLWSIFGAFAYMSGNFTTARFASRLGAVRIMRYGALITVIGLAGAVLLPALWELTPLTLFLPIGVVFFANGLVLPSAIACAVSVRPQLAGSAAGLSGTAQMGFGALATVLVGAVATTSATPMFAIIVTSGVVSVVLILLAQELEQEPDTDLEVS